MGYAPWGIQEIFEKLVKALKKNNVQLAIRLAADLAHYVGDLHNPLHTTSNYNGQLTGNFGLHGRFEADLAKYYISKVPFKNGKVIEEIKDFNSFTFANLKKTFSYVGGIIQADKTAQWEPGLFDEKYYDRFWMFCKDIYFEVLNDGADNLASYYHSAVLRIK